MVELILSAAGTGPRAVPTVPGELDVLSARNSERMLELDGSGELGAIYATVGGATAAG